MLKLSKNPETFLPLGLSSLFPGNISKPMYFCRIMGAFQLYRFHHCLLWESNVVPRLLSIHEKRNLRTRLTCLLSFQTQHEENFYYLFLFISYHEYYFHVFKLDSNFTEWCRITSLNIYGNVTRIITKFSMQREYITINTSPFLSLRY